MQSLMSRLWQEWEKYLKEQSNLTISPALLGLANADYVDQVYMDGAKDFLDFSINWLNRNMSRDFLIVTPQGEQFLLTDRVGEGDLPKSYAVHAIGEPTKLENDVNGVAITK